MESGTRRSKHLNDFVNSLRRITQAIRLSSSAAQDTLGITGAQLFVLQQLAEHSASSLRELAARTLTDQSSVSVVVSRLVASGHVTRRTSTRDHRRIELALTATGRALLRRAPELAQSRLVTGLQAIPLRELKTAATVLERLAAQLDAGREAPAMFFEPVQPKAGKRSRQGARS